MLLKLRDAVGVKKQGFTAYVYNTKRSYPPANAIFVQYNKGHERVRVKGSHRLYFVLEGSGSFTVGADQ